MSSEPALSLASTLRLDNGVEIPRLGLGVFRTGSGDATRNAVRWALEAGYRHVDTAAVYRNERDVGEAIAAAEVPREALFVTTKLWRDHTTYDAAMRAFDASLQALGLEQVDLYLVHWPVPSAMAEMWRALETIATQGRSRAIGVSNYTDRHLEVLLEGAKVVPQVNQLELHPFCQPQATLDFCHAHGIAIEAWGPLTKGQRLDDPRVVSIAQAVGRTPAQVLIRWSLQRDFIVIPKSANQGRIEQNAAVFDFELDEAQMKALDDADEGYRTAPGWDPDTVVV